MLIEPCRKPTPYSPIAGETKGVFMQAQMTSQMLSAVLDERHLELFRDWESLLESANLEHLTQQPLLDCCEIE